MRRRHYRCAVNAPMQVNWQFACASRTGTHRVLEGYSKETRRGTQAVLKDVYLKKGTQGVLKEEYSRGTQRALEGHSKGTQKDTQRRGCEAASGACGSIRRISVGQCSAVLCPLGVGLVLVDGSVYRALTGYSRGILRHPHYGKFSPAAAVGADARARAAMYGYSQGTPRVLPATGYSRGTHRVLQEYFKGTPTGTAHPAEHAALLRVLVAVSVGRGGQSAAVRGIPA